MTNRNIIPLPDSKEIEETAAHWIMRLEDKDMSEATNAEFRTWYFENEAHKNAFERLSSVWGNMDVLADLNDMAASDVSIAASKRDSGAVWFTRRRVLVGALAASILVVFSFGLLMPRDFEVAPFQQAYNTQIGEQETVNLPDGSSIILNTNTKVDIEFTKSNRIVRLESGEAYFEIAKDVERPFSVQTKQGIVTAVGTAFSVRVLDTKIDVLVTEGRVKLSAVPDIGTDALEVIKAPRRQSAEPQIVEPQVVMEVTAGQAIVFAQRVESLAPIDDMAIERELDWRDGVLAFKGESLEQVVADISRYTDLTIEITGEELRQQPIAGYFKVGETGALFDALTIMADVEVERIEVNRIRLYRKQ